MAFYRLRMQGPEASQPQLAPRNAYGVLAASATVAGRQRIGQDSSIAASGGSPGLLPESLFVLWRSCGVPRRLIGDLEQAWCADVQAREGLRIQKQHESLPFLRLHLHLLDLLVNG